MANPHYGDIKEGLVYMEGKLEVGEGRGQSGVEELRDREGEPLPGSPPLLTYLSIVRAPHIQSIVSFHTCVCLHS